MATALPSFNPPRPSGPCDTSDLILIHSTLRRLFAEAPGLVRAVADGDHKHTGQVAEHLDDIADMLHTHHEGQDRVLWDRLEQRSPACVPLVGRMRAQHDEISLLLDRLDLHLTTWRSTAHVDDGQGVAEVLAHLGAVLVQHLAEEEQQIVPIVAATLTQQEWDELAAHRRESTPKNRLLIRLGFLLESIPPEDRDAWMLATLPRVPRVLYTLIGKRQYAAHRRRVLGDA
ncbi:hemerythrin domain-containing protein [Cryobacterium sp. BB307]|uniref:hemerythrin domain-containing protein n=1 Tax=Cryobacterium sp. BB307 TaxID=2716317 RepID=UPI001447C50A|nr:hemerythrin domain-containing protein [Cryobacterium sp. BB307]